MFSIHERQNHARVSWTLPTSKHESGPQRRERVSGREGEIDVVVVVVVSICLSLTTLLVVVTLQTAHNAILSPRCPNVSAPWPPTRTFQFVFLGPMPILLLIWMKADEVLWFYYGFTVPALIYTLVVVPTWAKQDSIFKALTAQRIKVLQR